METCGLTSWCQPSGDRALPRKPRNSLFAGPAACFLRLDSTEKSPCAFAPRIHDAGCFQTPVQPFALHHTDTYTLCLELTVFLNIWLYKHAHTYTTMNIWAQPPSAHTDIATLHTDSKSIMHPWGCIRKTSAKTLVYVHGAKKLSALTHINLHIPICSLTPGT